MPQANVLSFTAILLIIIFAGSRVAKSQHIPLNTQFETSVVSGTNQLPFWMYANKYGRLDPGSSVNSLSVFSIEKPFTKGDSQFDFTFGASSALRISDTSNSLHFQQLFAGLEYGIFRLKIGRFYDDAEMLLPGLSSGSMMLSRNATPHPRIMLTTRGFIDVPYTNGIVQFRGSYADGILESDRVIQRALLHQKSLHLKFNFYNIQLITGFFHNVMWGGTDSVRGDVPQGLNDYFRVVFARSANPGTGATSAEEANKLGNTIASYDGALIIRVGGANLFAYRQIYIEDTVSLRLRSYNDGLYGLGLTNIEWTSYMDSIILEHINTIRQDSQGDNPRGRANYYNHYAYQTGWSYYGSVIGNPLLTFNRDLGRIDNNLVLGWHLGVGGNPIERFHYKLKATYSRNYGTCRDDIIINGSCFINESTPPEDNLQTRSRNELRNDQYSFVIETSYEIAPKYGLTLFTHIAADTGDFLGNRLGFTVGVRFNNVHRLLNR